VPSPAYQSQLTLAILSDVEKRQSTIQRLALRPRMRTSQTDEGPSASAGSGKDPNFGFRPAAQGRAIPPDNTREGAQCTIPCSFPPSKR